MATVTKASDRHTAVTTGWTNPGNAFAATGDNVYATALPGKSATVNGDIGFPALSDAELPIGATITAVRLVCEANLSASVTGGLFGVKGRNNGVDDGAAEVTKTTTAEAQVTFAFATLPTEADLKTAGRIRARCRGTKGNTNTALTVNLDFVRLEVDYTLPASWEQKSFRFRNDDGSETTATWKAAADTGVTLPIGSQFRLRLLLQNDSGASQTITPWLFVDIGDGSGLNVVGQSGTLADVETYLSANFADLDATTQQLGAGSFTAGSMNELDATAPAVTVPAGGETEIEFTILLSDDLGGLTNATTVSFTLLDTLTSLATYTVTPVVTLGSTGQSLSVTPATETDAAQTVDVDKHATLGPAVETDAAQTLRVPKLAAAVETDAAQLLVAAKLYPIGVALELDAAQALTFSKPIRVSITAAVETSTAQPVTATKTIFTTLVAAVETAAAQAVAFTKTIFKALTSAVEADTAQLLDVDKRVAIAAAVETDESQPLAYGTLSSTKTITPATETNAAQLLDVDKRATIAAAAETDTAQLVDADKLVTAAAAIETDTSQALDPKKTATIAAAVETDTAQPIDRDKLVTIAPAAETDAAQALSVTKTIRVSLVPAIETDAAQLLSFSKAGSVTIGPAVETNAAQTLSITKTILKTLSPATDTSTAQPLSYSKTILMTLGPAADTSLAVTLTVRKALALSPATETSVATPLAKRKVVVATAAIETTEARPLAAAKTLSIGVATTTDQAQLLVLFGTPGPPGVRSAVIVRVPVATAAIAGAPRAVATLQLVTRTTAAMVGRRAQAELVSKPAADATIDPA